MRKIRNTIVATMLFSGKGEWNMWKRRGWGDKHHRST